MVLENLSKNQWQGRTGTLSGPNRQKDQIQEAVKNNRIMKYDLKWYFFLSPRKVEKGREKHNTHMFSIRPTNVRV